MELAELLHRYIRARAESEGKGYGLTPEFFAAAIVQGCHTFFGATVEDNRIVSDDQNPLFFAQWCSHTT